MAAIGLMLLVAVAGPAGAFLLRWAVTGNRYARERWPAVAVYYGVVTVAILMAGAFGLWVFVFFPLVLGPFAALFLLVVEPHASARDEPRGFDVVLPRESASAREDHPTAKRVGL